LRLAQQDTAVSPVFLVQAHGRPKRITDLTLDQGRNTRTAITALAAMG